MSHLNFHLKMKTTTNSIYHVCMKSILKSTLVNDQYTELLKLWAVKNYLVFHNQWFHTFSDIMNGKIICLSWFKDGFDTFTILCFKMGCFYCSLSQFKPRALCNNLAYAQMLIIKNYLIARNTSCIKQIIWKQLTSLNIPSCLKGPNRGQQFLYMKILGPLTTVQ